MRLSRRAALAAAAMVPLAASCAEPDPPAPSEEKHVERLTYGDDPNQWAELYRPDPSAAGGRPAAWSW